MEPQLEMSRRILHYTMLGRTYLFRKAYMDTKYFLRDPKNVSLRALYTTPLSS